MAHPIDETGNRYGKLVVVARAVGEQREANWLCQCDCGNKKVTTGSALRHGRTKSCGCHKQGARTIDETGNKYGKLTVLGPGPRAPAGQAQWVCECECGQTTLVLGSSLRIRNTTACGHCRGTHKLSKHHMYGEWVQKRQRCNNPNNDEYIRYGGRGVRMCAHWNAPDAFPNYLADVGERPEGMTLHRIDNEGHYSCGHCSECLANGWPSNCRWATPLEQAQGRRPKSGGTSDFPGVDWNKARSMWRARNKDGRHIGLFDNELDAARAARPEEGLQ